MALDILEIPIYQHSLDSWQSGLLLILKLNVGHVVLPVYSHNGAQAPLVFLEYRRVLNITAT